MQNVDLGKVIPDVKVPSIQSYKINKYDEKIILVKETEYFRYGFPDRFPVG